MFRTLVRALTAGSSFEPLFLWLQPVKTVRHAQNYTAVHFKIHTTTRVCVRTCAHADSRLHVWRLKVIISPFVRRGSEGDQIFNALRRRHETLFAAIVISASFCNALSSKQEIKKRFADAISADLSSSQPPSAFNHPSFCPD